MADPESQYDFADDGPDDDQSLISVRDTKLSRHLHPLVSCDGSAFIVRIVILGC